MKKIKLFAIALTMLCISNINAQTPSYGTTGFNNDAYDAIPLAVKSNPAPAVTTATNVAGTGWSFHIGAIGAYVINQLDHGSGSYDGAIVATYLGGPKLYQTFAFTSTNNSMFKLNSVSVKISNTSGSPIPMLLAGVINGQNTGSTTPFVAMPGSNYTTVSVAADPNFTNINGVIIINYTGSAAVAEMAFDDINISAPIVQPNIPSFTTQPTDKTVCSGTNAVFTGTATNAAAYQWLVSTDGIIWNPINSSNAGVFFSGYSTNTLTVSNTYSGLNNLYLGLTAINAVGVNKGSNAVRLYVNTTPTVSPIIGASSVCVGASTTLTDATAGGVWSVVGGRATVAAGLVTGTSGGTTTIKYTVTSGSCSAVATKVITVNAIGATPSIGYAPGNTVNPIASGGAGLNFCTNKVFSLAGTPSGGTWNSTGAVSVTAGVVTTTLVTGAFSLSYAAPGACSGSRTLTGSVIFCAARGVTSAKANNNFLVYPNPSKSSIHINLENVAVGTNVSIANLMGKQVKFQPLSIGNNNIDISNLAKGIYLVTVNTAEGNKTEKLIVE